MAKDVNIEETLKVLEQKEKSKKVDGAPNEDENKESENVRPHQTIINVNNITTFLYWNKYICLFEFVFRRR